MSLNKVMLIGRLGQDPELKQVSAGNPVCNFSIATSENWTDKSGQKQEKTEWHRIVVWGKLAELCQQYLTKGRQAYVEGRLQTRSWEDKEGQKRYTTEILANTVQFLGSTAQPGQGMNANDAQQMKNQLSNATPAAHTQVTPYNIESNDQFASDEIPF